MQTQEAFLHCEPLSRSETGWEQALDLNHSTGPRLEAGHLSSECGDVTTRLDDNGRP